MVHRDESGMRLISLTYIGVSLRFDTSHGHWHYLCVKINIGIRLVEEILKDAEISRGYANCTACSHAHHATQPMNLVDVLEDMVIGSNILFLDQVE